MQEAIGVGADLYDVIHQAGDGDDAWPLYARNVIRKYELRAIFRHHLYYRGVLSDCLWHESELNEGQAKLSSIIRAAKKQ